MNKDKRLENLLEKLNELTSGIGLLKPTVGSKIGLEIKDKGMEVILKGTRADIVFLFSEMAEQLIKSNIVPNKKALTDLIETSIEED